MKTKLIRHTCPECYNDIIAPQREIRICDECGSEMTVREDLPDDFDWTGYDVYGREG